MATWIDVNSNYRIKTGAELSLDVEAIENSIENILGTVLGSRPRQRDYGSRLYFHIHEPMDKITEEDIRVSVIQSIERWEPRIRIDTQKTNVQRLLGNNGYSVEIHYVVIVPALQSSVQFIVKRIQ